MVYLVTPLAYLHLKNGNVPPHLLEEQVGRDVTNVQLKNPVGLEYQKSCELRT